MTKMLKRVYSK